MNNFIDFSLYSDNSINTFQNENENFDEEANKAFAHNKHRDDFSSSDTNLALVTTSDEENHGVEMIIKLTDDTRPQQDFEKASLHDTDGTQTTDKMVKKRRSASERKSEPITDPKDRKLKSDSLRKKNKTHLHEFLRLLLNSEGKINFPKLSQNFLPKVDITSNKILLNMTVKQIYYENLDEERDLLKAADESNPPYWNHLYPDFINYYLNTSAFSDCVEKLAKKYGPMYEEQYKAHALSYVDYYREHTANNRSCSKNKTKKKP